MAMAQQEGLREFSLEVLFLGITPAKMKDELNIEHEIGQLRTPLQIAIRKLDGVFYAETATNGHEGQERFLDLSLPPPFKKLVDPTIVDWVDKNRQAITIEGEEKNADVLYSSRELIAAIVRDDEDPKIYIPYSIKQPLTTERALRFLMALNRQTDIRCAYNEEEKAVLEKRIREIDAENKAFQIPS